MVISPVPVEQDLPEMDLSVQVLIHELLSLIVVFGYVMVMVSTAILPDPCLSSPCDANAVCERDEMTMSSYTCTCTPPYEGDGFSCSCESHLLPCKRLHNIIIVFLSSSS